MAKYNGLIIPRSYNDYFSRSDPQAIKEIVAMGADDEFDINSPNPIKNRAVAKVMPSGVSESNKLATAADIDAINELIPNTASADNQLADKNFVNSTVGTNTAIFRGTFNSLEELEAYAGEKTNNDYAFVITTDSAGNAVYNRYKYDGEAWEFEYPLNNSSFTAEQWAAIQSGITAELVALIGQASGSSPIGTILSFAGSEIPAGFLLCDGRELLISDYEKLYNVIGNLPECQSETTGYFKLPDLREVTIVGAGINENLNIAAHDVYALGQFKDDQMQGHSHKFTTNNAYPHYNSVSSGVGGRIMISTDSSSDDFVVASDGINGTPRTGTTTHGKQVGFNYIIKATSTDDAIDGIIDDSTKDVGHAWSGAKIAEEIGKISTYSTTEMVVGQWIDGKPIYRKAITGILSNDSIIATNVDTLINAYGQYIESGNKIIFPYGSPYQYNTVIIKSNSTDAVISHNYRTSVEYKIIIEYTKTTD